MLRTAPLVLRTEPLFGVSAIRRVSAFAVARPMMPCPPLTEYERMGIVGLSDADGDFCFRSFKHIAANCPLPQHLVRRTIRRLARKGLARFESGLCTEDGDFYGSGYALTETGRTLVSAIDAVSNLAFTAGCLIWVAKQRAASADTHPKGGDVQQAPLVSGAVPKGETPNA